MIPRRIAYVLNIFPKLSETFIIGELAELRRRGIELRILSLLPPRDQIQHALVKRAGLEELVCYAPEQFSAVLREFQPQLLHAHFAREATAEARRLATKQHLPFTFTAHGYDIYRKPPEDFAARAAAARAVVTVSEANAAYIAATFGVPRGTLHVIPCGVDTTLFKPGASSEQTRPPVVLCVARHVAVKNLGVLLEACAELSGRNIEFRCVMIGDGPLHADLKSRRADLGLDQQVVLSGAVDHEQVRNWWQRASVGVLTSDNEGMPVCLMEAAACGVPVVATRVGGIPELVAEGDTGLLTPAGDAKALAAALEKLLRDSALRKRMGATARARALEKFSVIQQVDSLLALWSALLCANQKGSIAPTPSRSPAAAEVSPRDPNPGTGLAGSNPPSRISDPFDARHDKNLPTLAAALDFETAWSEFKRRLPRLSGVEGKLRLKAIRVTRHKPGRRAVVEYDVKWRKPGVPDEKLTLIGKTRARRSGNEAYRLQDALWNAGFQSDSKDGISVPEPIGVISDFQMWFQRKVAGATAEEVFAKSSQAEGIALARRVAEGIHKVHRCGVPAEKRHTIEDELKILRECFAKVVALRPEWTERIAALQVACEKLGVGLGPPRMCGIHRDFYPAQVLVDGARLWLIDFDLYCQGDPGLDLGNFIGHLTEQALRERGDATVFRGIEEALEQRYVELSGEGCRESVRAYTMLTLARHIFLSTQFPERVHLTEALLELCEQRLKGKDYGQLLATGTAGD